MKCFVLYTVLSLCFITGLFAQSTDKKLNQPKENSKVTREYDEQGNLIRFDSVYSYSWTDDSTMIKHFSPEDMTKMFGGAFNFFNDSTIQNHSFFGDFDQLFADPFEQFDEKHDSIFQKHFGRNYDFQQFNDSTTGRSHLKSMDEMMQMFQQQFKEIEQSMFEKH